MRWCKKDLLITLHYAIGARERGESERGERETKEKGSEKERLPLGKTLWREYLG